MILSFITVQEVQPIGGAQDHSDPISVAGEGVVIICTKYKQTKNQNNEQNEFYGNYGGIEKYLS